MKDCHLGDAIPSSTIGLSILDKVWVVQVEPVVLEAQPFLKHREIALLSYHISRSSVQNEKKAHLHARNAKYHLFAC